MTETHDWIIVADTGDNQWVLTVMPHGPGGELKALYFDEDEATVVRDNLIGGRALGTARWTATKATGKELT